MCRFAVWKSLSSMWRLLKVILTLWHPVLRKLLSHTWRTVIWIVTSVWVQVFRRVVSYVQLCSMSITVSCLRLWSWKINIFYVRICTFPVTFFCMTPCIMKTPFHMERHVVGNTMTSEYLRDFECSHSSMWHPVVWRITSVTWLHIVYFPL